MVAGAPDKSAKINSNSSTAARRSSMISAASTSGSGKLAPSSSDSSRSPSKVPKGRPRASTARNLPKAVFSTEPVTGTPTRVLSKITEGRELFDFEAGADDAYPEHDADPAS